MIVQNRGGGQGKTDIRGPIRQRWRERFGKSLREGDGRRVLRKKLVSKILIAARERKDSLDVESCQGREAPLTNYGVTISRLSAERRKIWGRVDRLRIEKYFIEVERLVETDFNGTKKGTPRQSSSVSLKPAAKVYKETCCTVGARKERLNFGRKREKTLMKGA